MFWVKKEKGLDKYDIEELKQKLYFEKIDEKFKLINEDTKSVIVPYKEGKEIISLLTRSQEKKQFIDYKLIQRSQGFLVNVRIEKYKKLLAEGIISEIEEVIAVLNYEKYYNDSVGFIESMNPEDTIL